MLHQLSSPKTPEQNGLVEKKHCEVAETGLTLLFYAYVPNYLWVDAFSTAIFL